MLVAKIHCAICDCEKNGTQRWFLLAENRWEDKLRLLHWDGFLAMQPGIFPVCCPLHVRELAAQWIITGNLAPRSLDNTSENILQTHFQALGTWDARQIGELAVHHENMRRLLDEQPQSAKPVLDALLLALEQEFGGASAAQSFTDPSSLLTNQMGAHFLHSPAH